jgi:F-type H+-transporting ATPase subunit delta
MPGSDVKPEEAVAQLRAVEEVVSGSAELRTALMTPAIQPGNKRTVMRKLMDELSVSRVIRNLIFVVIDHRRVGLLTEIREAFEILMDERLGFVRADVISAAPLEQEQSALLQSELSRLEGKQVRLRLSVDPALLGGAAARIGSTVYDGSIRGQLQEMRRKLAAHSADYQVGI